MHDIAHLVDSYLHVHHGLRFNDHLRRHAAHDMNPQDLPVSPVRDHLDESLRLAASVQNVATITKYRGLDPELTSADGVDNNIFPRPRLYTVRINVNF